MSRTSPRSPASSAAPWRELPECTRALVVRSRADHQMVAIEQQHERIHVYGREVFAVGLLDLSPPARTRGLVDVDFFLASVRRLLRVCHLARRSALPTASLRAPIRTFEALVGTVTPIRDLMEHLDDATVHGRGGLDFGITPDQVTITYDGSILCTLELLNAARQVHRAIRAVVDPIAVGDVH